MEQISLETVISWLELVPDHILIAHVLPYLTIPSLLYLCRVNRKFSYLCQNQETWIKLLTLRYSDVWLSLSNIQSEIIPKNLYLFLSSTRRVPVWYEGKKIGYTYATFSEIQVYLFVRNPTLINSYKSNVSNPNSAINQRQSTFLIYRMFPEIHIDVIFLDWHLHMLSFAVPIHIALFTTVHLRPTGNILVELTKGEPQIYGYINFVGTLYLINEVTPMWTKWTEIPDYRLMLDLNILSKNSGQPIELTNPLSNEIVRQLDLIGHFLGVLRI